MDSYQDGFEEEKEESIVNQPQPDNSYKIYSKQPSQHFNASHISQQNDEESYRPNESVNRDFSPPKAAKRVDSLGPEEEEINIREDP